MKLRRTHIAVAAALLATAAAYGQTGTSYFLDNYIYSYKLNPAAKPADVSFFGALGFGGTSLSAGSNAGLSDYLFPVDGKLVTGLNNSVPAQKFLGGLPERTELGLNFDKTLASFGTVNDKGMAITVDLSSRTMFSAGIPKTLFSCLKEGSAGAEKYYVNNLTLDAGEMLELAVGLSFDVGPVRIGGRIKGLSGLADAYADVRNSTVDMSGDDTYVDAVGDIRMSRDFTADHLKVKDIISPSGFGVALDLGASFNTDKIQADFSILDLGGIGWKNDVDNDYHFQDYVNNDTDAKKVLKDIIRNNQSGKKSHFSMLDVNVNAGGRYSFNDMLSAGLHASLRKQYYDVRAGFTFTPGRIFSLAATGGMTKYGPCFGAGFNLLFQGLSLFGSIDNFITDFTPQYIPVNNLNTSLSFGMVVAIR